MKNTNKTDSIDLRKMIVAAQSDLAKAKAANDIDTVEGLVLHIEELELDFDCELAREDGERERSEQE